LSFVGWSLLLPLAGVFLQGAFGSGQTLRRTPSWTGWATAFVGAAGLWALRSPAPSLAWPLLGLSLLLLAAGEAVARAAGRRQLGRWGLAPGDLPTIEALPTELPPEVEAVVDRALRDYRALHALVTEGLPGAAACDGEGLLADAHRTLTDLLSDVPAVCQRGDGVEALQTAADLLTETLQVTREYAAADSAAPGNALRQRLAQMRRMTEGMAEIEAELGCSDGG
jgi:hypothetical protein